MTSEKISTQFLTAVFELRLSNHKAAVLENVRARTEKIFWQVMNNVQNKIDPIVGKMKKDQASTLDLISKYLVELGKQENLAEPVICGIDTDIEGIVKSYLALKAEDDKTSWPTGETSVLLPFEQRLDVFVDAFDKTANEELLLKDELGKSPKQPLPRPFLLIRERDCQIVRNANGKYAAILYVLLKDDKRAKHSAISEGVNISTGEGVKKGKRKTVIIAPISCSKWHEYKFLSGKCKLKSCKIVAENGKWYMHAAFAFPAPLLSMSGNVIGIDRGCVYPVSLAVVDPSGKVLERVPAHGEEIVRAIKNHAIKVKREQKLKGMSRNKYVDNVSGHLHIVANMIVKLAKQYRAEVVIENLDGFKRTITTPHIKGNRHNPWAKILKKAQLGKLELMIEPKLKMAGIPPIRKIAAGGTSQTCAACGYRDKENRKTRDQFICVECGHADHADDNASIIIARRGVLMRTVKKGDKLDALHRDMVIALNNGDRCGLGMMVDLDHHIVAAHVASDAVKREIV